MPENKGDVPFIPLTYATPPEWAERVLQQPLLLLNDHAWLEKKAANNALDLLNQWPGQHPSRRWVTTLSRIAQDEAVHLAIVCRLLQRRGGELTRVHRCTYAGRLRQLVRKGRGPEELIDRLLVAALIEARSCERFQLLAAGSEASDISQLYRRLWRSELGHYKTFLKLASEVLPARDVQERWTEMLQAEGQILASEPVGVGIHSGVKC